MKLTPYSSDDRPARPPESPRRVGLYTAEFKRERFIQVYLQTLNATEAARQCGVPDAHAGAAGAMMLRDARVQEALREQRRNQAAAAKLNATAILRQLALRIDADPRSYVHPDGTYKNLHELTEDQAACIESWETVIKNAQAGDGVTDTVLKVKLWSKKDAMELAMKHLKMLTDRVEIDLGDKLLERLDRAKQRARLSEGTE